jgi:hypothetical protein
MDVAHLSALEMFAKLEPTTISACCAANSGDLASSSRLVKLAIDRCPPVGPAVRRVSDRYLINTRKIQDQMMDFYFIMTTILTSCVYLAAHSGLGKRHYEAKNIVIAQKVVDKQIVCVIS